MKQIDYKTTFKIFAVPFDGIQDVIRHAISGEPKSGVFVGYDSEDYPCFDSYDYASENRSYWNFVFAKSQEYLAERLAQLKHLSPLRPNFNKLTEDLHPMVYWGGEDCRSVFLTEGTQREAEE